MFRQADKSRRSFLNDNPFKKSKILKGRGSNTSAQNNATLRGDLQNAAGVGMNSFLKFPQRGPDYILPYASSINEITVRTIWDNCFFAKDWSGAAMALRMLCDISSVELPDFLRLLDMHRCLTLEARMRGENDLCEDITLLLRRSLTSYLQSYRGHFHSPLESQSDMISAFVQFLINTGDIDNAVSFLQGLMGHKGYFSSPYIQGLHAAVAITKLFRFTQDLLKLLAANRTTIESRLKCWPPTTIHELIKDPFSLNQVVRFANARIVWSMFTKRYGMLRSRTQREMALKMIGDIKSLLTKIVGLSSSVRGTDFNAFYAALLSGLGKPSKGLRYLLTLARQTTAEYSSETDSMNQMRSFEYSQHRILLLRYISHSILMTRGLAFKGEGKSLMRNRRILRRILCDIMTRTDSNGAIDVTPKFLFCASSLINIGCIEKKTMFALLLNGIETLGPGVSRGEGGDSKLYSGFELKLWQLLVELMGPVGSLEPEISDKLRHHMWWSSSILSVSRLGDFVGHVINRQMGNIFHFLETKKPFRVFKEEGINMAKRDVLDDTGVDYDHFDEDLNESESDQEDEEEEEGSSVDSDESDSDFMSPQISDPAGQHASYNRSPSSASPSACSDLDKIWMNIAHVLVDDDKGRHIVNDFLYSSISGRADGDNCGDFELLAESASVATVPLPSSHLGTVWDDYVPPSKKRLVVAVTTEARTVFLGTIPLRTLAYQVIVSAHMSLLRLTSQSDFFTLRGVQIIAEHALLESLQNVDEDGWSVSTASSVSTTHRKRKSSAGTLKNDDYFNLEPGSSSPHHRSSPALEKKGSAISCLELLVEQGIDVQGCIRLAAQAFIAGVNTQGPF